VVACCGCVEMAFIFDPPDWPAEITEAKRQMRLQIEAAAAAEARRPRPPEPPPPSRRWRLPPVQVFDVGQDPS